MVTSPNETLAFRCTQGSIQRPLADRAAGRQGDADVVRPQEAVSWSACDVIAGARAAGIKSTDALMDLRSRRLARLFRLFQVESCRSNTRKQFTMIALHGRSCQITRPPALLLFVMALSTPLSASFF